MWEQAGQLLSAEEQVWGLVELLVSAERTELVEEWATLWTQVAE